MVIAEENEKFAQVVQKIDPRCRLLRAWKLEGGVSAQVTALEVEGPGGQREKMLVRRHGEVDRRQNPQIAADEFQLLHLLQSAGMAAPEPYYLDVSKEIFSTPYIVVEYIEGQPEFAFVHGSDFIHQLALYLSRLHQLGCSKLDISFLPRQRERCAAKLGAPANAESGDERHVRAVLQARWPLVQRNPSVLLHGDFWPGNILWKDGQLVAVIDWEDAASGDPLADLGNSRLEVLWAFGVDAMQRFTDCYRSITSIDFTHLPYWDLYAALRLTSQLVADGDTATIMRERYRWFIAEAQERLLV
jgi:aminoglycoside phosphotransferase (APT) family kinase protein